MLLEWLILALALGRAPNPYFDPRIGGSIEQLVDVSFTIAFYAAPLAFLAAPVFVASGPERGLGSMLTRLVLAITFLTLLFLVGTGPIVDWYLS